MTRLNKTVENILGRNSILLAVLILLFSCLEILGQERMLGGISGNNGPSGQTGDTQAPTPPTNLVSANITETTVSLSWNASTDNVGVTGYDVYLDLTVVGTVSGTSFIVSGLSAGSFYSFFVKAKDAAGNISPSSNIIDVLTIDTHAPNVPTSLIFNSETSTSINLTWDVSTDNVGVTEYEVYQGSRKVGSALSNSYIVTGLSVNTEYSFCVKAKDAANNVSECSNIVSVTTMFDYCLSKGNDQKYEWITGVNLGDINRTSGSDGGYTLSSQTTKIIQGETYTISYSSNNTQYTECFEIWIDYNRDGDFYDVGERIVNKCIKGQSTSTFTVPLSANGGKTRMRVSMQYNSSFGTPCGTLPYGEVEDYNITIEEYCGAWSESSITYIENVKLGSIDNSSGASNYTDYSELSTLINDAETFKLEVKVGVGFSQQIKAKVFIDWNNDLDFDDQDENYQMSWDTWTTKTLSLNFDIPLGTEKGMKLMRIKLYYSSDNSTACGSYAYGEVEDYSLNYKWSGVPGPTGEIGGSSDTEDPTPPTNLEYTSTNNQLSLSWDPSTDNIGVVEYYVYQGSNIVDVVSGTTSVVTDLTPFTTYTFCVKARDAVRNFSDCSEEITATTGIYCDAWASSGPEYIDNVKIGTINNSSGRNNYSDYTNLWTYIDRFETYKLDVKVGNPYGTSNKAVAFIDWNENYDFTDANEKYTLSWDPVEDSTLSITFSIPEGTELGIKRLRIRLFYFDYNENPCGNSQYGEVEDYILDYKWAGHAGPTAVVEEQETQLLVSPNPANTSEELTVKYDSETTGLAYINIYDISGNMVLKTAVDKSEQILAYKIASTLPTGTYIVQVIVGDESNTKKIRVE